MSINLRLLSQIIYDTALTEDLELQPIAPEGVFYMPELAFVYQFGKAIRQQAAAVFGTNDVDWMREWRVEHNGISKQIDCQFRLPDGHTIAIEVKVKARDTDYMCDISALAHLPSENYTRLFVALVDSPRSLAPNDKRITSIENQTEHPIQRIFLDHFKTKRRGNGEPHDCVVGVWLVQ